MQVVSCPVMRSPREEDRDDDDDVDLSLEHVNFGGGCSSLLLLQPDRMEFGTPRGNETTIGSCSGLLGETFTLMVDDDDDDIILFLGDDAFDADDEALRFLVDEEGLLIAAEDDNAIMHKLLLQTKCKRSQISNTNHLLVSSPSSHVFF